MAFCEQCRISIGWFGKRKFRLEDGRTIVVCANCADRLQRQAALASRSARTFDAPPSPSAPEPAPGPSALPAEVLDRFPGATKSTVHVQTRSSTTTTTGAGGLDAALDQLRAAGMDGDLVETLSRMVGQAGAPADGATASSSVQVRTPRGSFQGTQDEAAAAIERLLLRRFLAATGIDLSRDELAATRIREVSQGAVKGLLSGKAEVSVNLPFLAADARGPRHLDETLRLEDLVEG